MQACNFRHDCGTDLLQRLGSNHLAARQYRRAPGYIFRHCNLLSGRVTTGGATPLGLPNPQQSSHLNVAACSEVLPISYPLTVAEPPGLRQHTRGLFATQGYVFVSGWYTPVGNGFGSAFDACASRPVGPTWVRGCKARGVPDSNYQSYNALMYTQGERDPARKSGTAAALCM